MRSAPLCQILQKKVVTRVNVCDSSVNFSCAPRPMSKFAAALGPLCQSVCTTVKVSAGPGAPCQIPPKKVVTSVNISRRTDGACQNLNLRSGPLVSNSQKKRRRPCGDVRASGPCVKFYPPVSKCKKFLPPNFKVSNIPGCAPEIFGISCPPGPKSPSPPPVVRPSTARHILGWCTTTCLLGIPSRRPCSSVTHL